MSSATGVGEADAGRREPELAGLSANGRHGSNRQSPGRPLFAREDLERAIGSGSIRELEVMWPDHQGIARGKRIPARRFLSRAEQLGFPFCDAALGWDYACGFHDGLQLTGWSTGCPDCFARPDLSRAWLLPWNESSAVVHADLTDAHGELIRTAPRTVLRRAVDRLATLGFTAEVGIECEFHLLTPDGAPLTQGDQAYSLEKMNEMEPAFGAILAGLEPFVAIEAGNVEYGPGQCEVNLVHAEPMAAADQALRLKYAVRELARRAGVRATFMAKPFNGSAGNSMHLHMSLWADGRPAFVPELGAENILHRQAIGGILQHLPGIVLYGAPTVNSYKRFEPLSFAPTTATWGRDNRTCAVRSLIDTPDATRLEFRIGAADANPYLVTAALLAAICAGVEDEIDAPQMGEGNMYQAGQQLPQNLGEAIAEARADTRIVEIMGQDAVHDYTLLAGAEWMAFCRHVSDWDRERYLAIL